MSTSNTRPRVFYFGSTTEALSYMPPRKTRSNKGDYGRVLCVCGSRGMAGAAYLAAKAAYRTGAGLVEIFTHESNRIILQTSIPEAIVTCYRDTHCGETLHSSLLRADCVVAGCGLGVTPLSRALLEDLLVSLDTQATPTVLDADALNLIAQNPSLLKYIKGAIITPHALEMSRLTGKSVPDILADTQSAASNYASEHGLICLLKDHRTVVSDGGERVYLNTTGNSGMSTGGSGDVLSGILGGILAQSKNATASPLLLTSLGAYIHGRCGDIAAAELGEYSLMASDLINALPKVMKEKIK